MNKDRFGSGRVYMRCGLGGALLLAASACGVVHDMLPAPTSSAPAEPSQEASRPVPIQNILGFKIKLSDNPNFLDAQHSRGFVDVGATAMAECLVPNKNYPNSSSIYMKVPGDVEGYASIYSPGSKDRDGTQEFSLNYQQLRAALPDCFPTST